jgi:hypothetical protein
MAKRMMAPTPAAANWARRLSRLKWPVSFCGAGSAVLRVCSMTMSGGTQCNWALFWAKIASYPCPISPILSRQSFMKFTMGGSEATSEFLSPSDAALQQANNSNN